MNDYKEIWQSFINSISNHKNLKDLIKRLDSGNATYEEAQKYSSSLANYLVEFLSAESPTNAEQVLEALKSKSICKNFFKEVDDYTYSMQKILNEANDIGLNAVKVASPRELIDSTASLSNDYEKDIANLANKVELNANKHVDTVQQANARFQSDANYSITVSRTYDGKGLSDGRACKWCLSRVGHNVPYDEAYKRGMFQRHEGCHCIIEYNNNGAKTYQTSKGGRNSWIAEESIQENKAKLEKLNKTSYNSNEYRAYELAVNSGELTPLADFKLYHTVNNTIDNQLVGKITENGIKINGKSNHFVARVIGSVEQKRDGVIISKIRNALTNPIEIKDVIENANGRSQTFIGNKVAVSINPDTGVLIQTNPLRKGRRK